MLNVGDDATSCAGSVITRMFEWYSSNEVGCTKRTCFDACCRVLLRRPSLCFLILCLMATWRAFADSFATFSSTRESRGAGFLRGILCSCGVVRCALTLRHSDNLDKRQQKSAKLRRLSVQAGRGVRAQVPLASGRWIGHMDLINANRLSYQLDRSSVGIAEILYWLALRVGGKLIAVGSLVNTTLESTGF